MVRLSSAVEIMPGFSQSNAGGREFGQSLSRDFKVDGGGFESPVFSSAVPIS